VGCQHDLLGLSTGLGVGKSAGRWVFGLGLGNIGGVDDLRAGLGFLAKLTKV